MPDTSQIEAIVSFIEEENSRSTSPIAGVIETEKLALLGHSGGGAVGLSALGNLCLPFLCNSESFIRPPQLVAGIFFGANLRNQTTNEYIPIGNDGIPTALIQGDLDGRALPVRAKLTYDEIQSSPKALITVTGVNHFGITDVNNPPGAIPDPNSSVLAQQQAIETVGRWSGNFLRASILNDSQAREYVYFTGDQSDDNVSVISSVASVDDPSSWFSLVAIGSLLWVGTIIKTYK